MWNLGDPTRSHRSHRIQKASKSIREGLGRTGGSSWESWERNVEVKMYCREEDQDIWSIPRTKDYL